MTPTRKMQLPPTREKQKESRFSRTLGNNLGVCDFTAETTASHLVDKKDVCNKVSEELEVDSPVVLALVLSPNKLNFADFFEALHMRAPVRLPVHAHYLHYSEDG
jgi:hypothetical protein